jgi:hypothetical protein
MMASSESAGKTFRSTRGGVGTCNGDRLLYYLFNLVSHICLTKVQVTLIRSALLVKI